MIIAFFMLFIFCTTVGVGMLGQYNLMISLNEGVRKALSDVDSIYQRRNDLIPNLVSVIKEYASHEKFVLENITKERTEAMQNIINIQSAGPDDLKHYQESQSIFSSAIGKLMAIAENYPDLKASETFKMLQQQLETSEDRIVSAIKTYNYVVKEFNTKIKMFPLNVMIATLAGFYEYAYFKTEGRRSVPNVFN